MTDTTENLSRNGGLWKQQFLERILKKKKENEKKENHYTVMTGDVYNKILTEVQEAELAVKKVNQLNIIYLLRIFLIDIIEAAHGGRDRLKAETSRKYANITIDMINIRVGLATSSLPLEVVQNIHDEEALQNIFNQQNSESLSDVEEDGPTIESSILLVRQEAHEGLKKQAEKMKLVSDALHPPAGRGDNIMVPIPDVDRSKADLRNIIGVVLEKNEDGLYKVGTKYGILEKLYCRSEFDITKEKLIKSEEVPEANLSLRTLARHAALGEGQGFARFVCKETCNTNRCFCKKKGKLCNSKCHDSQPCRNK